jgi:hypothetical protein
VGSNSTFPNFDSRHGHWQNRCYAAPPNLKRPRLTRSNRARHAKRVVNLRLQGIAAALGELAGAHRESDLAAMVLDSLGLTVADLEAAGADAVDLEPLKSASPNFTRRG